MNVIVKGNRQYVDANQGVKDFKAMLKVVPSPEVAAMGDLDIAIVVDTSSSMRDEVRANETKLDKVMAALREVVNNDNLKSGDRVSLIRFDSEASTVWSGALGDKKALLGAIAELKKFNGSTFMAKGIDLATDALAANNRGHKKLLVFTDGETFDEAEISGRVLGRLKQNKLAVISFGVGESYNEKLLSQLGDSTTGTYYHLEDLDEFRRELVGQVLETKRESIRDVHCYVEVLQDIVLQAIRRIYPAIGDVEQKGAGFYFGNLPFNKESVFIFELELPARPSGRQLVMEVELGFSFQGGDRRTAKLPLVVEYTTDRSRVSLVDSEVMHYMRQGHIQVLIDKATDLAKQNKNKEAAEILQQVNRLTKEVKNPRLRKTVQAAIDELKSGKRLTEHLMKGLTSDGRTKTVFAGGSGPRVGEVPSLGQRINPWADGLSDEDIIRMTEGR